MIYKRVLSFCTSASIHCNSNAYRSRTSSSSRSAFEILAECFVSIFFFNFQGKAHGNVIGLYSRSFFQRCLFNLGCFVQRFPWYTVSFFVLLDIKNLFKNSFFWEALVQQKFQLVLSVEVLR